MAVAQTNATNYAAADGLTLESLISISDVQAGQGVIGGPYSEGPFEGPFGVNQYCGIERRPLFTTVDGKRKLKRLKKVHACVVPRYEATTLTVSYNTQ